MPNRAFEENLLSATAPNGRSSQARSLLLLIEDDDGVRRGLQLFLQGHNFDVHAFASLKSALADPVACDAPFVVIDYVLREGNGIAALGTLRERGWDGVAVLITAFATAGVRQAASAAGFKAVVDKPFRDDELLRTLRK